MNLRHIFLIAVAGLTLAFVIAGPASGRPLSKSPIVTGTPDLVDRWLQRQVPAGPDLIERYVQRQPAASFYSPAALKAYGLRMQAMARTYESAGVGTTSNAFDTRDALIGAAGGLGIAIFAAGLLVVTRSRRPQVAL
jgi:hypothetical protein